MATDYMLPNIKYCRLQLINPATGIQFGSSIDLHYISKEVQPIDIYKGVENINDEIILEDNKQRISIKILIPNNEQANMQSKIVALYALIAQANYLEYDIKVYPNYHASYTLLSQDRWICVLDGYPKIKQIKSNLNVGHVIELKLKSKFPEYFFPRLPSTSVTTNPIGLSTSGNTGDFIANNPGLELKSDYTDLIDMPDYVDDDDIFAIPTMYAGFGEVMIGNNQEYTMIRFDNHGGITLIDNTLNISTTKDSAAKLNIYDNGEGIAFQNKLGAPLILAIDIHYYLP